jgi:hypothetical protein
MPNLPTTMGLALAALLSALPATAAEFAVKDLSGEMFCLPEAFGEALQTLSPSAALCSPHPAGTIEVVITPEADELPVECHDSDVSGRFCMYAADVYLAAQYQGRWYAKTTSYAWTPVDDLAQLPAASHWAPWGGTGSLGFQFYANSIDLNTSQVVALPEGTEVYVGITPAGTRRFAPEMVTRIYPLPSP